ncbi:MAG: hypothetical protein K2P25_03060 [Lachnospiraceae bacterium]|nr:hypothetical protein [Lachnospiraceae bacterium]
MAEISEKSFPFDSDEIDGKYDREYFAEDWARYFAAFISSGTFLREPTNLQIIANGDMSVTLKPGSMMIDGTRYDNVADIVIQLEPADGVLSRIDRISITWSKSERDTHYTLQKGIMSYNPVPPECRRNAEYKDYVVADIRIDAGVISINQSTITDQRLNSEVCGVAIPFAYINTESLALQLQAFYEETMDKQAVWEQDMQEQIYQWFQDVQDQLSSDAAFNLQKQIGRLAELKTENKDNLVTAINEVKTSIPIPIANMLATEEGNPLDAVIGKELKDLHDANAEEITKLNGNLGSYLALRDVATTSGLTTGLNWVNFTIPQISRYTPRLFLYAGNSTNAAIINYARNALILSSATTISIPIYNNQNALTSVGFSGIVVYTKDIKS